MYRSRDSYNAKPCKTDDKIQTAESGQAEIYLFVLFSIPIDDTIAYATAATDNTDTIKNIQYASKNNSTAMHKKMNEIIKKTIAVWR